MYMWCAATHHIFFQSSYTQLTFMERKMKKNFMTLAFMLVFASTTVFADGELNHGNRNVDPTTTPTSNYTNTTDIILNQILNIIYSVAA